MGLIKELKRLGNAKLKLYEKALASRDYTKVKEFFDSENCKASDFSSDVIRKYLKPEHKEILTIDRVKNEVLEDNLKDFDKLVERHFNTSAVKTFYDSGAFTDIYNQDDASVGCQKARASYANALSQANKNIDNVNNDRGVQNLYLNSIDNLVAHDNRDEAIEILNDYMKTNTWKMLYARFSHGDASEREFRTAFVKYNAIADVEIRRPIEEKQKIASFYVENLDIGARAKLIESEVFNDAVFNENVSPEVQAEYLEQYVENRNKYNDNYIDRDIVDFMIEKTKTNDGQVTALQEKAFELFEKYDEKIHRDDKAKLAASLVDEVKKGNVLALNKYFKDTRAFVNFYTYSTGDDVPLEKFAMDISYDNDGIETPAKPYVVNSCLNIIEKSANKKHDYIDVTRSTSWEWGYTYNAVEAVARTGSKEDLEALQTLYKLQEIRHENNIESINGFYDGTRAAVSRKEEMMKHENKLLCGVQEVLVANKLKLELK